MKIGFAVIVAAIMAFSAPASAQKLDLSTVKCKDFLESSKENIGLILMWLHGYYTDEDSAPIVDFDKMKSDGEKLGAYCATNPEAGLITAVEQVME